MNRSRQHRLDRMLAAVGLVRVSRIPRMEFDFQTREIFIQFGNNWRNRVHGYVCPTPDGPLKKMTMPENPVFSR